MITPRLLSLSPRSGPTAGGATVTLTGVNFLAGATVTFDGIAATNVTVVSDTQITVTTPGAPDSGDGGCRRHEPNGGTDTLVRGYTYGTPNPLPSPQPSVSPGSPTNPLPQPRPAGTTGGPAPDPLPGARP